MIDRLSLVRKFFDQSAQAGVQWNVAEIEAVEQQVETDEHAWHETVHEMVTIANKLGLSCHDEVRQTWNGLRPLQRVKLTLGMDESSKSARLDYLEGRRQPDDYSDLLEIAEWAVRLTFRPSYLQIMARLATWDSLLAAQVVAERSDRDFAEMIAKLVTMGNPPKAEVWLRDWDALVTMADAGLLEPRWTGWIASRRRPVQNYAIVLS